MEGLAKSYGTARTNLERYSPAGGALQKGYRTLSVAEAGDKGRLYNDNLNDAVSKLAAQGSFGTSAGISAGSGQVGAGTGQTSLGGGYTDLSKMQASGWGSGLQGIGSIAGKAAGKCSMIFKRAVEPYRDHEAALAIVMAQPLATFEYIGDGPKRHIGIITEQSNPQLVSQDGLHVDYVDVVGVLIGAIQAQQRQIEALEARLA
jgi:hypothetical protein